MRLLLTQASSSSKFPTISLWIEAQLLLALGISPNFVTWKGSVLCYCRDHRWCRWTIRAPAPISRHQVTYHYPLSMTFQIIFYPYSSQIRLSRFHQLPKGEHCGRQHQKPYQSQGILLPCLFSHSDSQSFCWKGNQVVQAWFALECLLWTLTVLECSWPHSLLILTPANWQSQSWKAVEPQTDVGMTQPAPAALQDIIYFLFISEQYF